MKKPIPSKAFEQHSALLGSTGAGKTSVAKVAITEPALKAGERALIIDPTGGWYGLRIKADGKGKGFPIYIFGGDHGDYPLRARDAGALAEAFGTSSDSAIFDTSIMTVSERTAFFTDFAQAILRKNRGPLRFIIDEAHLFMPQAGAKSGGGVPAMLHAGNNLVSLGRGRGFKIALISQRPAELHKDSLTQVQTLIAMRVIAPQDRKAIAEWVDDQADPKTGRDIIASLPGLKDGEAWVWSPLAGVLDRVQFPMPQTFDSSRAPQFRQGKGPTLSPIDLDALKGRLATLEEERKANDPKELKSEVARLKSIIQKQSVGKTDNNQLLTAKQSKEDYESGFGDGWRNGWVAGHIKGCKDQMKEIGNVSLAFTPSAQDAPPPPKLKSNVVSISTPVAQPIAHPVSPPKVVGSIHAARSNNIDAPLQKIVDAIAWWNAIGIPSHPQVGFVAGYSHKSGTWSTYLSKLRSGGYIEGRGDLTLTETGTAVANYPPEEPTGEQLREIVLAKVDGPLRKILGPIIAAYPNGMGHAEAGEASGYSHSSGTWSTYLSKLRSLDLIEGRGEIKAQSWLFP